MPSMCLPEIKHHDRNKSFICEDSFSSSDDISLGEPASPGSTSRATDNSSFLMRIPGTLTVGKVSVLILLFATVVDFCVCQVQRIDSPDLYDALSADVIRPAFNYHQQPAVRTRASLGSAAISSVTEVLSPILPFAGGLDLRREDYWQTSGSWVETLQSVASQVQEAFYRSDENSLVGSIPRGGGNAPGKVGSRQASTKRKTKHDSVLSAQQPFISIDAISDLTLSDVSETFRYALECNKEGFNEGRFINSLAPRVKKVVTAMQAAAGKSRGKDAKISQVKSSNNGEIDALAFSAAMRVFGEWRVLRQVPDGYKGYAVGMSLGHKDIVQNLAKIEQGVHDWLDRQRDLLSLQAQWEANGADENCPIDGSVPRELRSPTLRELLNYEIEMDINPPSRLPRLKEKSAAMGLLWVRRQLHYQTLLFDNVLKIPSKFSSTADAVSAAYQEVYDRFHGWAVQKIFTYSFQSAPEAEVIYKHMDPWRLEEVVQASRRLKQPDARPAASAANTDSINEGTNDNPFDAFVKHVGGEWDKFASSFVRFVTGQHHNNEAEELAIRGGSNSGSAEKSMAEAYITQEMVKDAHEHITSFLDVSYPLLGILASLFDELNMDDPTKV